MYNRGALTIYILVALAFLTHVGFAGSRLVVPLFALQEGATPFVIGTIAALYAAFPLFLALPAGRASDRLGFKLPLILGTTGMGVGLLIAWIWPSVTTLYVTATLLGIGFMALQLGVQTLAGAIARVEDRSRNFSFIALGFATANFAGPLLTGYLIDEIGHARTFAALAVPIVPAIIVCLFGKRWLPASARVAAGRVTGTVADLLRIKPLRDTLLASAIISGAWDVYQFFMPIYAQTKGISATHTGVIMSAFAISIILVRVFLPYVTRRVGEAQLLTQAMFVACIAFALFPLFDSVWALAIVSFILGIGCGCGQPLSMTLLFAASPKGRVGEVTGLRITGNQMMHTAVPLVFGALGSVVGSAAVFLTNAVCVAAGGWVSWRASREVKR